MTTRKNIPVAGRELKIRAAGMEILLRFAAIALILLLMAVFAARSQSIFSGDQLRAAVIGYASGIAGSDAEITALSSVADEKFTESGVTARCVGETFRGQCSVGIEFLLDGKIIRRTSAPVFVKIYRRAPVAVEQILTGTTLSDEKVIFRKQDISAYSDADIPAADEIKGATLRRTIAKGALITRSALLAAGGVRKGETVSLRVISGAIVLTAPGTALNDASPGETVRVIRSGSSSILSGLLAEDSAVEILMKK